MDSLRWVWRFVSSIKWLLLLAILLAIMESLSFIASIGLQKFLIDEVIIEGQHQHFFKIMILMAISFTAYSLLFVFAARTRHIITSRVRYLLGEKLMLHMHKIPVYLLQQERTARFVHLFSQNVFRLGLVIGVQIPWVFQRSIALLVLMVIVFMASPVILICVTAFSITYFMLGKYFAKRLRNAARDVEEKKSALLVHIEEGISSTREVIAFHRLKWEAAIYNKYFQKYFNSVMEEGKLTNKQIITSDPIRWGANLFVLGYGGYLVFQDTLSIGMFVITYQFTSQLMDGALNTFRLIMGFFSQTVHIDKIREVMDGEQWDDGKLTLKENIQTLQFTNVSFQYHLQKDWVIQRMNFNIPMGKKVAFVGSSGGGKSTIAQLLIRNYDPSEGNLFVNRVDFKQIQRADWMKRVSIVFQEPYLFPDSLRHNLLLGQENVTEQDMIEVCKMCCIHDFIMGLPEGYDSIIGERGIMLSGGQRQRIALARAVLRNSEILILDEATSALDLETERAVVSNLDAYRKNKTTIVIAHRLSTVQNADIIYVLDQGRIVEQGSHQALIDAKNQYFLLTQAQAG